MTKRTAPLALDGDSFRDWHRLNARVASRGEAPLYIIRVYCQSAGLLQRIYDALPQVLSEGELYCKTDQQSVLIEKMAVSDEALQAYMEALGEKWPGARLSANRITENNHRIEDE